jgi:hypothetical protein
MLTLIQFLVFYVIVPVIYIAILAFDTILIIRASTLTNRWRGLAAILAGFLTSAVIILLDQVYGGLFSKMPPIESLEQVWPAAVIMVLVGFFLLLIIDLLLRKGVVPFVILFTVAGVMVSGYYLLTLTQLRTLMAVGAIGFVVGTLIYFMVFPNNIAGHIQGE